MIHTDPGQGTVLSPFLFILYISDFRFSSQSCHLQKFSDDSAIVGCISRGQEEEYRSVVDRFVEWCGLNHLQLNVTKTKELVVDFRRQRTRLNSFTIRGTEVDIVDSYKYLGVHLDNKLDWTTNTDAIYKKGQSHFLRRLRSFNVCRTMPADVLSLGGIQRHLLRCSVLGGSSGELDLSWELNWSLWRRVRLRDYSQTQRCFEIHANMLMPNNYYMMMIWLCPLTDDALKSQCLEFGAVWRKYFASAVVFML
ncbi:hypothetical protein L3Q82_011403 [Scortum barcoo]|uniref:Uncharacterized protein n=1 Tax=Scortum barcoo TaxID=214431 RepID=A0ACB8W9V0_9TELE|nr:hypothetical protein L3Q82_011403 [Scortum barcoo]